MTQTRDDAYLKGAVEALLFVSDEPVTAVKLATFLEVAPEKMDEVLANLARDLEKDNRGIQLREVAGGWRLYSHPAYHELIESYIVSWDTRKLSQAALETLAVVAYHQPVTRASINAIRGVSSEGVVSSLVEKGLVREAGREKSSGGAILYTTTRTFLEKFGLKSTKDLPPLEDFAPDEATRDFIRARLGGQLDQIVVDDEETVDELPAVEVAMSTEYGVAVVEDVDRGDEERVDDAGAMSEILSAAITEKVESGEAASALDDIAATFAVAGQTGAGEGAADES